jgi:hypothetical protein
MSHIEIPGPFTFFRTHDVPPVRIGLPLVVSANISRILLRIVIYGIAGVVCLGLAGLMGTLLVTDARFLAFRPVIALVSFSGVGLLCIALVVRYLRLARHPTDQLVITASGLHDARQDAEIAWSNVRAMRLKVGRNAWSHVTLDLNDPIRHRVTLTDPRPRMPGMVTETRIDVPLQMLQERPYVLAHTIGVLVRQHGGTVPDISHWD